MKGVELYGQVRYAVQIEGLSHREAGYYAMRGNERCHDAVTSCIGRFSGGK